MASPDPPGSAELGGAEPASAEAAGSRRSARRSSRPPPGDTSSPSQGALRATQSTELRRSVGAREHIGDLRRARPVLVFGLFAWPLFVLLDLVHLALGGVGDLRTLLVLRALPMPWFLLAYFRVRRRPPISSREFMVLVYGTIYVMMLVLSLEAMVTGGFHSLFAEAILPVLAATTIVPRPARKHALPMVVAAAIYPLTMLLGALFFPPMRGQLGEVAALYDLGAHLVLVVTTTAIVVLASNRLFTLRREIAEVRSIGRYELRRRIGKGGMGEVWAAWHRGLEREVALKILRIEGEDEAAAARFEREIRVSSGLSHPHTVRVFDSGSTEDGLLYYAMELLEGVTLAELVKREGPLPPARAVHLVTQAARALAEAHEAGIVHRDVKPENLFVTSAGGEGDFVKVLDFGIARLASEAGTQLTQTGAVAGTPATMSPEVIQGGTATAASDVYGLGAVLYITLTGRPPFKGESPASTLLAHLHEAPVPPSERAPRGVPSDVDAIVLRTLHKEPSSRFPNGRALADALARSSVAGQWTPALVTEPTGDRQRAVSQSGEALAVKDDAATPARDPKESDTRVEIRRR
jgi:serine/threonine-protein kinase